MRRFVSCSAVVLVIASCAPPPAAPPPVEIAKPAPSAPSAVQAPDPAIASVIAARVPAQLAIDGDLSEWGSLLPDPPKEGWSKKEMAANPRDAASHVAVALHGEGVIMAADLGEAAREGVWVGLDALAPQLPPVGEWARFGVTTFMECMGRYDDPEFDPDTDEACKAVRKQATDFEAEYARRFRRFYRIDREGVRVLDDRGALAPIAGAKAVFKPGAKGATAEVSLPVKALPRMSRAPVETVRLVARAATSSQLPAIDDEAWVYQQVPNPVGFEPLAALRAAVFGELRSGPFRALSFQPGGDPLEVEIMAYPGEMNRRSLEARAGLLYAKQATLGDVEIGYAMVDVPLLVSLHKGGVADVALLDGRPMGVRERDGGLHVFSYAEGSSPAEGRIGARWAVVSVGRDGKIKSGFVDEAIEYYTWTEGLSEYHDKDFRSFGVRGGLMKLPDGKPEGTEMSWGWDEKKKRYVGKTRKIPLPKSKRP